MIHRLQLDIFGRISVRNDKFPQNKANSEKTAMVKKEKNIYSEHKISQHFQPSKVRILLDDDTALVEQVSVLH